MRMLALTIGTLLLFSSTQAFAGGDPTQDGGKPTASTSPVKQKKHHHSKPKSAAAPQAK